MPTRIQLRRDTDAAWTTADPVLAAGEIAVTIDSGDVVGFKIGNGTDTWTALPYFVGSPDVPLDGSEPMTGGLVAPSVEVNGARFMGAISNGVIPNVAHLVGDYYVDTLLGQVYICVTAGTPGTFRNNGRKIAEVLSTANQAVTGTTQTDFTPSLTCPYNVPGVDFEVYLEGYAWVTGTTPFSGSAFILDDVAGTLMAQDYVIVDASNANRKKRLNCVETWDATRLGLAVGAARSLRAQIKSWQAGNTFNMLGSASYPIRLGVRLP